MIFFFPLNACALFCLTRFLDQRTRHSERLPLALILLFTANAFHSLAKQRGRESAQELPDPSRITWHRKHADPGSSNRAPGGRQCKIHQLFKLHLNYFFSPNQPITCKYGNDLAQDFSSSDQTRTNGIFFHDDAMARRIHYKRKEKKSSSYKSRYVEPVIEKSIQSS